MQLSRFLTAFIEAQPKASEMRPTPQVNMMVSTQSPHSPTGSTLMAKPEQQIMMASPPLPAPAQQPLSPVAQSRIVSSSSPTNSSAPQLQMASPTSASGARGAVALRVSTQDMVQRSLRTMRWYLAVVFLVALVVSLVFIFIASQTFQDPDSRVQRLAFAAVRLRA